VSDLEVGDAVELRPVGARARGDEMENHINAEQATVKEIPRVGGATPSAPGDVLRHR